MVKRRLGSVLLARLGEKQEAIARRCGVRRSAVGHWMTGHAVPADDSKIRLRDVYGVPLESWFLPHDAAVNANPVSAG